MFRTLRGRVTARGFYCGHIEERGEFVTIEHELGAFHIKRSPHHPRGGAWESCHTVKEARRIAARMGRGGAQ